ncbi:MAG: sulfatase [Deltaproteobacteria bacterium]|nr:sulfatase [Deltaproteobacteria bacterium]
MLRTTLHLLSISSLVLAACSSDRTAGELRGAATPQAAPTKAITKAAPAAVPPAAAAPAPATPQVAAKSSLPTLKTPHHAVVSLLDSRMLGHLIRDGGLAITAQSAGLAKYTTFDEPWRCWKLNKKLDDTRVALSFKSTSWLSFPLTASQAREAKIITLRISSPATQGLRVKLNNKTLKRASLSKGSQRVQLAIPEKTLHAGENRIDMIWAKRGKLAGEKRIFGALHWLQIGKAAPNEHPPMQVMGQGGLLLPKDGGLAYYLYPQKDAKLRLSFAAQPAEQRCGLQVTLKPEKGEARIVVRTEETLTKGMVTTSVEFGALTNQPLRVELQAVSAHSGGGNTCKSLELSNAEVVMAGPEPKVSYPKRPKNVLFWLVDNWRADHFRASNPKSRVETPVMDELVKTGTFFDSYIVGTESRVSHASLWTGMYPKQHRFIGPKNKLRSSFVTLAEALRKKGFYTAGWSANGNITRFWGFGEGWNYYRNTLHKGGGLTAKALANHAIGFVEKHGDKSFYLYIGTIDPHVSWRGRQPWLNRYYPAAYHGIFKKNVMGPTWDKLAGRPKTVSATDRKRVRAIYDSTISYNDQHLGRVLQALEKKGIRNETMIVIVADHGEEFWEYGRIGHGASLRDTVVNVPLIIHYPPLFGSGVHVKDGAEGAAMMATVLDAVGVEIPDTVQMASLLPLAQGVGRGYPRPRYATQYELARTMRLGRYKLWVGGQGDPRLYDMESKRWPEATRLEKKQPLVTRMLTDALSTFLVHQRRWRQSRWGVANNHLAALPEDLESGKGPGPIR